MNRLTLTAMATIAVAIATPSIAGQQIVDTLGLPVPAGTGWGSLSGENTGTAAITNAQPRSGNGSLELTGDRVRVQTGVQYGGAGLPTFLNVLSDTQSLTFDWMVASDSSRTDYTPALRLMVQDGSTRSELIWEGAYNSGVSGLASSNPTDTWYSTTSSDVFWQYVSGAGANESGGVLQLHTIADWKSLYSPDAFVSAISVGQGSGASAGYHAFVDNVTYTTTAGSTTYNFETPAVPEPASWALMISGFAFAGATLRRRKPAVRFA